MATKIKEIEARLKAYMKAMDKRDKDPANILISEIIAMDDFKDEAPTDIAALLAENDRLRRGGQLLEDSVAILNAEVHPLRKEVKRLTAELDDIGKRLKGFPESQLDGEHGLAASTMVCYERLEEENEKLRAENELLKKSIDLLTPPEHPTIADCANTITGVAGGEDEPELDCELFSEGEPDGDCLSNGWYRCVECEHFDIDGSKKQGYRMNGGEDGD